MTDEADKYQQGAIRGKPVKASELPSRRVSDDAAAYEEASGPGEVRRLGARATRGPPRRER